jgi:hypothetical protein
MFDPWDNRAVKYVVVTNDQVRRVIVAVEEGELYAFIRSPEL